MKYRARKGIVLTSVCGQFVLVAAKKARENCPYLTQINETAASCWRLLENGSTEEELTAHLMEEYDAEEISLVREDVKGLLAQFLDAGYIVPAEKEERNEKNE